MDGKGAWRDNIVVERLWRSIKYECEELRAYTGRVIAGELLTLYRQKMVGPEGFEPPTTPL